MLAKDLLVEAIATGNKVHIELGSDLVVTLDDCIILAVKMPNVDMNYSGSYGALEKHQQLLYSIYCTINKYPLFPNDFSEFVDEVNDRGLKFHFVMQASLHYSETDVTSRKLLKRNRSQLNNLILSTYVKVHINNKLAKQVTFNHVVLMLVEPRMYIISPNIFITTGPLKCLTDIASGRVNQLRVHLDSIVKCMVETETNSTNIALLLLDRGVYNADYDESIVCNYMCSTTKSAKNI